MPESGLTDIEIRRLTAMPSGADVPSNAPDAPCPAAEEASALRAAEDGLEAPDDGRFQSFEHDAFSETRDSSFVLELQAPEKEPATQEEAGSPSLRQEPAPLPLPPTDPELVALRELVFQRELALLDQLATRLNDPDLHAREVGDVLAEALLLRARRDDKLTRVLEPLVEKIFTRSLRKNRFAFVDAFFPLMGPAIRRSIAETFRSMLESLNKSVEMSLSWKGLRWRLEGWRTGRPFSEIVLLHTLLYRVEQIFFIHSATGLVLAHVVDEGIVSQDADMVSAMLTAIQDFVRDCFSGGKEAALEQMQFEEFTILVETSPLAYLACVVRGTPPIEFRKKLRTSLELMLVDSMEALVDYNGDSAPFGSARRLLEDCLDSSFVEERKALPLWIKALPVLLILSVGGGIGYWTRTNYLAAQEAEQARQTEERRLQAIRTSRTAVVEALRKEPGILVLHVDAADDQPWKLTCLRDELALPVTRVIAQAGGQEADFKITELPYDSLEPEILPERVRRMLRPPRGVRVEVVGNGILKLSGSAPLRWILHAKQIARTVPGIQDVDTEGITDPRMPTLLTLRQEVEAAIVEFPLGKDLPVPEDLPKLEKTVDTLIMLESLARDMGISASLAVYGYADASGKDKRNFELGQARARMLAAMLYARGSKLPITVYGMSAEFAAQHVHADSTSDFPSRRLELRIHLAQQPQDVLESLEKTSLP